MRINELITEIAVTSSAGLLMAGVTIAVLGGHWTDDPELIGLAFVPDWLGVWLALAGGCGLVVIAVLVILDLRKAIKDHEALDSPNKRQ